MPIPRWRQALLDCVETEATVTVTVHTSRWGAQTRVRHISGNFRRAGADRAYIEALIQHEAQKAATEAIRILAHRNNPEIDMTPVEQLPPDQENT